MDEAVSRVLEKYHGMISEERASRAERSRDERFMAVGPATGQLLNVLVRSLDAPHVVELGTSFGYSTIWLAEAARATGGRVTSMESNPEKAAFARRMAREAGLAAHLEIVVGDALEALGALEAGIDFVLLDLWKDLYVPCLEAFHPGLNDGAIVVADNMIRPGSENVARYAAAVRALPDMETVRLPVGSGLDVSRRTRA